MDQQKQQIVEKLKASNNILVTVSSNPSVDQLSACIGLTLLLNKLGKHGTAVFSGTVPSTIEFLKPEETIEKTTDSLRDFIIALDKSKADKLRYKVEDRVVKIFITPYRTSLSSDDLEFSQGDFNVDVVLALGVHQQSDLDEAITAHGRILHDATVMCINNTDKGELGSVNWVSRDASSLSELASELATALDRNMLDGQIATAFLTGIVAETDRFRNEKTSAATMSISADLMKAGANQQLVANELDHEVAVREQPEQRPAAESEPKQPPKQDAPKKHDDGTLEIDHNENDVKLAKQPKKEEPAPEDGEGHNDEIDIDEESGALDYKGKQRMLISDEKPTLTKDEKPADDLMHKEPAFGGTFTANAKPEDEGLKNVDMLNGADSTPKPTDKPAPEEPPVSEEKPVELPAPVAAPTPTPAPAPATVTPSVPPAPTPPAEPKPTNDTAATLPELQPTAPEPKHETLTELEEAVGSPHVDRVDELEKARSEVLKALNEQPSGPLPPIDALNAQPLDLGKETAMPNPAAPEAPMPPAAPATQPLPPLPNAPDAAPFVGSPADQPLDMPLPPSPGVNLPPAQSQPPTNAPAQNNGSAPPVPPPFMPGNFGK